MVPMADCFCASAESVVVFATPFVDPFLLSRGLLENGQPRKGSGLLGSWIQVASKGQP